MAGLVLTTMLVPVGIDAPLGRTAVLRHCRAVPRAGSCGCASAPGPVHWLVVAAEPVTSVDVTAADVLSDLDNTLHHATSSSALPR
jgi:hypothetical protein